VEGGSDGIGSVGVCSIRAVEGAGDDFDSFLYCLYLLAEWKGEMHGGSKLELNRPMCGSSLISSIVGSRPFDDLKERSQDFMSARIVGKDSIVKVLGNLTSSLLFLFTVT
jgi:hypothetical protein